MPAWTTIPPWLYENDLPDDQLQEVYIRAARKKLAELLEERRVLDEQIGQAQVFLAQAMEAMGHYRRRLRGG